ncbi:MltR family transcriptional regulator [Bacillus wiedmannii]|uniref:MltR family transcriptional regulator n=1 Tax=Bacillus wiedmannii TaxID=1890302 RepID=UPI000BF11F08|nr:MltR family transcriptional regulator [Bacillus wiedmannii]PEM30905.1 transcriptional regulator [Bacillus wiedmannii]
MREQSHENYLYERYVKHNEFRIAFKEFEKELENSSDRGIALICGSIIDQLLNELLKSFFIKSDTVEKDLFKGNGVLATFDSKIKMSYYLGLISKKEKTNITYLQRIRNKFAHQFVGVSFENNDIINICRNFEIPLNCFMPMNIPSPDKQTGKLPKIDLNPIKKDTTAKDRFIYTFRYIYFTLLIRITIEGSQKREENERVVTAEDMVLMQKELIEKSFEVYKKEIFKLKDEIKGNINDLQNELQERFSQGLEDRIRELEIELDMHFEKYNERCDLVNKYREKLRYFHDVIKKSAQNKRT